MSKIDIIRRIANTKEGRAKIGLPNEIIQVNKEGENKYAFIYRSGCKVLIEASIETEVIRCILSEILPEDYKLEISQKNTDDDAYSIKCSVYNTRNFHTMSFSYGATYIEATGRCLLEIIKLTEDKDICYEQYNKDDIEKISTKRSRKKY